MTEDSRIREIRAALARAAHWTSETHPAAGDARTLQCIRAILDSAPPAPRVFFPGDTVPAEVAVLSTNGAVVRWPSEWKAALGPCVEVTLPSPEEFQAAVDRARTERTDAEWQHTEGITP